MAKRRRRKAAVADAARIDPQEVLAGRVEADAGLLLDLIHRVNPTGLGVSAAQQKSRYHLKSRLQSLLVERFADELEFEAEPGSDDVALIRHRYSARDACHAVLSELEADARFLARRRLDEQASSAGERDEQPERPALSSRGAPVRAAAASGRAAAEGGDDALSAGEILAKGSAALEAFRYDDAGRFFRLAVERSGGEVEAARALLGLLVDHLADYAEALRVAVGLPPQTWRDPLLRVLAGRAAAGCGRPDLALEYIDNIRTGGAAEVHATLASAALREGELEQAAHYLARADEVARDAAASGDAEAAPLLLELGRLQDELSEKRARQREPEEREVEQLVQRGELQQAEQLARQLLERWPESRAARAVLRRIEDDRKQERVRELVARADEAHAGGAYAEALQHLGKAVDIGGDARALRERIEAAEQRLRAEQERAEVKRVGDMLRAEDRPAGLLAYLALDDGLRARVRERAALEPLSWLEQQGGGRRTGARARADAEAVLALRSAAVAMERGDAEQALALIGAHEGALKGVAVARGMAEQARKALAGQRQKRSARLVASAREALERGEHREALGLLREVDARVLEDPGRALADELSARAGRLGERERLVESYRRHLQAGELLQARDVLQDIADLSEGRERTARLRELEGLAADIRRQWRVRVIDGPAAGRIDLRDFDIFHAAYGKPAWLTPDGRWMVAATTSERWLLLRVVEMATGRVQTAVLLRTPKRLGRWPTTSVQEGSVCVLGDSILVELSLHTWDILRWYDFASLIGSGKGSDSPALLPGGRMLWTDAYTEGEGWKTALLDLEQRRVRRVLPIYIITLPLRVEDRTLVLCSHDDKTRVYTETGTLSDFRIPGGLKIEDATPCPDADRIALLVRVQPARDQGAGTPSADDEEEEEEEEEEALAVVTVSPDGTACPPLPLADTDPELTHCMATGSAAGLLFVLARSFDIEARLWALKADEQGLSEQYSVFVSDDAALVQDVNAKHTALIEEGTAGLRVFPLFGSAPDRRQDESEGVANDTPLPSFKLPFFCWNAPEEHRAFSLALMKILADTPRDKRGEKIDQFIENNRDEPESLLTFHGMLRAKDFREEADQLAERLAALGASWPAAAFPLAERYCGQERWKQMTGLLEPLAPAALEHDDGEHLCHLLAMALIADGRPEDAVELLRRALERFAHGRCGLENYLKLAEPLPSPLLSQHWGPDMPRVRQLAGAVASADVRLAAGDLGGAREAVDRPVVWRTRELQSFARLAEVFLGTDEGDDEETLFFKVRALAEFCDLERNRKKKDLQLVHETPFPGRTWSPERMGELAARARAWLDGLHR